MWRRSVRHVGALRKTYLGSAARRRSRKTFVPLPVPLRRKPRPNSIRPQTSITGFEASDNYASGYVGAGYALGKAGLYERRWRLRAIGAYGRYHYDGALLIDGGYVPTTFDGEDAFLSAVVGYQLRNGRLITKLFVGIEAEDQHHDPNNSVQGTALGLRLEQETWFDISPRFYLSADAS